MLDEKLNTEETSFSTEAIENKSEQTIIDYENYEVVCNHFNDGSRRRGILSKELYETIVNDPNTIFVDSNGLRIPVLMDVNHGLAMGYDTQKCQEYAKDLSSDIKILTLPAHELNDDEIMQFVDSIKSNNSVAIYFSDHNNDEADALATILNDAGLRYAEKPLIDPRANEDDKQAGLYLYSCSTEQKEENNKRNKLSLGEVQEYYEKNMGPLISSGGKVKTILSMGNMLSHQITEQMWDLYNNKFDSLGEGHPISMQDEKKDFLRLLSSNHTIVSATYETDEIGQDKVACFTYFIEDMDSLYWLNKKYLKDKFDEYAGDNGYVTNIFTPGIVSSGIGKTYSFLPIGLFTKAADEAGINACVLFENTNFSKSYVPRIVDAAIGKSCRNMILSPSEMIDKVSYRLWVIENGE